MVTVTTQKVLCISLLVIDTDRINLKNYYTNRRINFKKY